MDDTHARVAAICERYRGVEGATLPILHEVQAAFGYVPAEAVPLVAAVLDRTRAEIRGIVAFYRDFRDRPAGRHLVRVCRAEACRSMGANAVVAAFERALGIAIGDTSADGGVTLEPVYCLGLCASAPNAMIDGNPARRLDAARAAELAQGLTG